MSNEQKMNSKIDLGFIKNLIEYCLGFIKASTSGVKGLTHFRRGAHRKGYFDFGTLLEKEPLFCSDTNWVKVRPNQKAKLINFEDVGEDYQELDLSAGEESKENPNKAEGETDSPFEALRTIYGMVKNNPHELELLYGFIFLEGMTEKKESILSPLFTVPASMEYLMDDDSISINCDHDFAHLNIFALSQISGKDFEALEEVLRDKAQIPLPLTINTVKPILNAISTLIKNIKIKSDLLENLDSLEKQTSISQMTPGNYFIKPYSALAVIKKTNVFILEDLKNMVKAGSSVFENSLVERFFQEEIEENQNDDDSKSTVFGNGDAILFPLRSNERQIRAAKSIEKGNLIRIQGPPGTGKSQTIANLVCHLVARNQRVLVASQQKKAIKVVQDKLEKLGVDFLPMTLLKGDREAGLELFNKLDGLRAFSTKKGSPDLLESRGKQYEQELLKAQEKVKDFYSELARSIQFEAGDWKDTKLKPAQLIEFYEKTKEFIKIKNGLNIEWADRESVSDSLRELIQIGKKIEKIIGFIERLKITSDSFDSHVIASFRTGIVAANASLKEENAYLSRAEYFDFNKYYVQTFKSDVTEEKVIEANNVLFDYTENYFKPISKDVSRPVVTKLLSLTENEINELSNLNQVFETNVKHLFEFLDDESINQLVTDQDEELKESYEYFISYKDKWFRWLVPNYYQARKALTKFLKRNSPVTPKTDIRPVAKYLNYIISLNQINRIVELDYSNYGFSKLVKGEKAPKELKTETYIFGKYISFTKKFVALKVLVGRIINNSDPYQLLINENIEKLKKDLTQADKYLCVTKLIKNVKETFDQISSKSGAVNDYLEIYKSGNEAAADKYLKDFDVAIMSLKDYEKICDLQDRKLGKIHNWINEILISGKSGVWPDGELVKNIVMANALEKQVEEIERLAPRSEEKIYQDINKTEDQILEKARLAVQNFYHSRIIRDYSNPNIGNNIKYFSKILKRGKNNYDAFFALKNDQNCFRSVLSVLPCWVATIQDVARVFPLVQNLFDVVIVDEASQCSIPSAMPLFIRSNKAIIVGDDKQLPCVEGRFVNRNFNEDMIKRFRLREILPRPESFNACYSSLFDLAGNFTEKDIFLSEHFRCDPSIIEFSNRTFYDNRLEILTHGRNTPFGKPIEFQFLNDSYDDQETKINKKEAEAVVKKLRELIDTPEYENLEIGVCSPFRNQTDYIWDLIQLEFKQSEIEKHKIISSTADGFQGDERDIILYSWRYSPNSRPGIFTIADGEVGKQRLNVAITRARYKVICFLSASINKFPNGLISDYLKFISGDYKWDLTGDVWDSKFEIDVHNYLENKGLFVRPQVNACGYRIDFVIQNKNRSKTIALEADGWEIHYVDGKLREEDLQRQAILKKAGWTVFRVNSREFYRNQDGAMEKVLNYFSGENDDNNGGLEKEEPLLNLVMPKIDVTKVPLSQIKDILIDEMPAFGEDVEKEKLFRKALERTGNGKLGKRIRDCFEIAISQLINSGQVKSLGDKYWKVATKAY